jgi:LysR family glycine cleavage system transcriptional activator
LVFQKENLCLNMATLPPLNALRAFEVSARRGGFVQAAEELNVTPAAIGQQVRQLEALIGADLFVREGRRLSLTDRGAAALDGLTAAFDMMGEASAVMRGVGSGGQVKIAVAPDCISGWLSIELARWSSVSGAELDLMTESPEAGFEHGADLALWLSEGEPPYRGAKQLITETVSPLARPGLLSPDASIDVLDEHNLIEDTGFAVGWSHWFGARGADGIDKKARFRIHDTSTALTLAGQGAGIVLARKSLAARRIDRGELTSIFPDGDMVTNWHYVLAPAPGRHISTGASQLADFLVEAVAIRTDMVDEL